MTVRRLSKHSEIFLILPVIERDAKDVGYDLKRINYDKLLAMLEHCFEHAAIFVAEVNDKIVGIMVLHLLELYWSDDWVLTNLVYWVDAEHRKSRFGAALLKAAKDYAREQARDFNLCVESHKDLDRKNVFFQRQGFTPVGGNYQYKVT